MVHRGEACNYIRSESTCVRAIAAVRHAQTERKCTTQKKNKSRRHFAQDNSTSSPQKQCANTDLKLELFFDGPKMEGNAERDSEREGA